MNIPFLDIAYPGRPRHPRIPRRVIDTIEQVKKEVTDTAVQVKDSVERTVQDTTAQLQDFVAGGNVGSDDNTTLLWSLIVVLAALLLCLWFAYTYRKRLNVSHR